ncbi:MAG: YpdA family putative bacillithiol disulfide reductase [Gemmatimonadetes bacterium]|nr:YpdA family putative bacillithiol disulfide reductase [Gemmatimonadota bacterium]
MSAPVAIVGAGPCGLAAAVALKKVGIASTLFDRSCLVSAIAGYPTYVTFFSTPEKLEIGGVRFKCAGEKPTRQEGLAYYRGVATKHGIYLRQYENVEGIERAGDGFIVHSTPTQGERRESRASAVIIATGYFAHPNLLGVPGENLPHVSHRFVEGHGAFQRDALVVGGGNSAVECALELARCGARVTLAHYETGFVSHVIKPWIRPEFDARVAAGEITTVWSARVSAIEPERVVLAAESGTMVVPAHHVYVMTGYTPTPGLLGTLSVPFDPDTGVPEHDPTTMETPVPGVFLCGVLTSGSRANGIFIENGRGHGEVIARALQVRWASEK